jgi:hypothetical protein
MAAGVQRCSLRTSCCFSLRILSCLTLGIHGKALLIEEAAGAGVVFGRPIVLGGAGGYLVMNVYKPLMMHKIARSIAMVTGCANLHKFPVEGTRPDLNDAGDRAFARDRLRQGVEAHYAMDNDLTLKEAALKLGLVSEEEFDRVVDPAKLISPCSQERRSSRAAALER